MYPDRYLALRTAFGLSKSNSPQTATSHLAKIGRASSQPFWASVAKKPWWALRPVISCASLIWVRFHDFVLQAPLYA